MAKVPPPCSIAKVWAIATNCKKQDTPPPKPPVAEAGNPQTIQLPVNSATLTGSGASTNGSITSYQWTLVSGPSVPVLGQAGSSSTSVTGMIQGIYHFQFKVTDAAGLTGTDTTSITVLAALIPPVANAGDSQTVQLPTNTATLTGSGTTTNGNITGYQWTLISGPNVPGISQPTASSTGITGLVGGTYYFQLRVTDAANLTGLDTTAITVLYDVQTGLVAYYNFNFMCKLFYGSSINCITSFKIIIIAKASLNLNQDNNRRFKINFERAVKTKDCL